MLDELLQDKVKDLLSEWKACNEYAKKISTEAMHDEHDFKHMQTNIEKKKIQRVLFFLN